MKNKIKVVLLCHFWSEEITKMIRVKRNELSPWVMEVIKLFEDKNDIELHVIAPNYGNNKNEYYFKNNIHFHFYQYTLFKIPQFVIVLINLFLSHKKNGLSLFRFNTFTNYTYPKTRIKRVIKSIKPDLIHLYGSENLNYSIGVLPFQNTIPILLSVQGYICKGQPLNGFMNKKHHRLRVSIEYQINKYVKYITNKPDTFYLKHFTNNPTCYIEVPPITTMPNIDASKTEKQYDIVFYSRITQQKGIEDLIEAIYILKNKNVILKTLVIGSPSICCYMEFLSGLIKKKKLTELFTFSGFIPNHQDVFKEAAKAKVFVLPTHEDFFNNSIREAMLMKLPVIANDVNNISIANTHKECITLTKCGNIDDLVNKIELVLNNNERTMCLIDNAYIEMHIYYSPINMYKSTVETYQRIMEDTIQQNLL